MTKEEAIAILSHDKEQIDYPHGAYGTALEMAIKALQKEPCNDCVSREAVLEQIDSWSEDEFLRATNPFYYLRKRIESLPSVNTERKVGYWIENAPEWQNVDPPYICSECGYAHLNKTNYCDQCGTKMKSEE